MLNMKRQARKKAGGAEVIADRLDVPWTIAHTGETFYITERNGGIVSIADGKKERMRLQLKKPVHQEGEGGSPDLYSIRILETVRRRTFIIHTKTGAI